MPDAYVHGHAPHEIRRLHDQARTLADLIHADTVYPVGHHVLEAGCGAGAQTLELARRHPGTWFTAVDRVPDAVDRARHHAEAAGHANVSFRVADLDALPFTPARFDHVFVCFVLEHLPAPARTLAALARLVRPGGTVTVVEGDHGTVCAHPDDPALHRAVACQEALQRRAGGGPRIGRRLRPLLADAGLRDVHLALRPVCADGGDPALAEAFTRRTFTAMVAGVRDEAVAAGLTTPADFDAGLRALHRTAEADGMFCYGFFKAVGTVPGP